MTSDGGSCFAPAGGRSEIQTLPLSIEKASCGASLSLTLSTTFWVCAWPPRPPFGAAGASSTSTFCRSTRMTGRARPLVVAGCTWKPAKTST